MVFKNEKFIKDSHELLKKLDKKNLWDGDTLVVALDNEARPLYWTLKKIADNKGMDIPDVKYISPDIKESYGKYDEISSKKMSSELKNKLNPEKVSHYNKIVVLSNNVYSGNSLKTSKEALKDYLSGLENPPDIYLASLGIANKNILTELRKKDLIFVNDFHAGPLDVSETGMKEQQSDGKILQKQIPAYEKEAYQEFASNRKKLNDDIDFYVPGKKKIKWDMQDSGKKIILNRGKVKKSESLEKIISGVFVFSFLFGLFLSFSETGLTGNVIGTSGSFHKLLGIILVLFGIGGFFVYRKLR